MIAFLAIVEDTWRQSKQQLVFLLLAGLMLLTSVAFVALPQVQDGPDGKPVLGMRWQDPGEAGLEQQWDAAYRDALKGELRREERMAVPRDAAVQSERRLREAARRYDSAHASAAAGDEIDRLKGEVASATTDLEEKTKALREVNQVLLDEAQRLIDQRSGGMSELQKGVEVWMSIFAGWLFTLSMWGFIAASAAYFPHMLAAGAVDVLVSKPVGRSVLFFGKYAGGLALYLAVLLVCYVVAFVGVGARTGVWHGMLFAGTGLTLFSVALLYAIVGCIGVFTRSTGFAIVIGYVFYFVIDSIVGVLQSLAKLEIADSFPALARVSEASQVLFPGFGRLKEAAAAAVIAVPVFEGQVLLVAAAWLLVTLGIAYRRFETLDF